MDFFCFPTCRFFSHFIAFALRPKGSTFDVFFYVFRLAASFPIFLALLYGRRVLALMDFFSFFTCSFFSHFIGFGLRPSGSSFDGFFLFFDFQLHFPFYFHWFKAVGFILWLNFYVFPLAASFPILLALIKGRRVQSLMDFFVLRLAASFPIFLPLV